MIQKIIGLIEAKVIFGLTTASLCKANWPQQPIAPSFSDDVIEKGVSIKNQKSQVSIKKNK